MIGAAILLVTGLWMLFLQPHFQAWRRRVHEAALADRRARGRDAWFEEQRELEAYPPETVSPPMQRVFGALMAIFGAGYLAILLFGPEAWR